MGGAAGRPGDGAGAAPDDAAPVPSPSPAPRPAETSSNISSASTIPAACIRPWATSAQRSLSVWRPNPVHFFGGRSVLDALRYELRKRNYLPILFDFNKPSSRTTDETITLLARMARFVIADISDAKSVLQELRAIVPELPSVPVQPVIITSQEEPGMFDFYRGFRSFLPVHRYDTPAQLLAELTDRIIEPSEAKALEFRATPSAR